MADALSYWDGKASIEHQIQIHVNDLIQLGSSSPQVIEILLGLEYVMNYRIKGSKQRTLEMSACEGLVKSLLLIAGEREKRTGFLFGSNKLTVEADLAFLLLAEYVSEVDNCLLAILKISTDSLKSRLLLGKRILKPSDENIFNATVDLLTKMTRFSNGILDWRDFFDEDEIDESYEKLKDTNLFVEEDNQFPRKDQVIPIFPPAGLYFDRNPARVLDMFNCKISEGLSSERALEIQNHYGLNSVPMQGEKAYWRIILGQFLDFIIIILIITTAVSAVIDYPNVESAIVLGVVVILNVAAGSWQEIKSARTVASMRSMQIPIARVRRDGKDVEITSDQVVPGDIVLLGEGEYVSADLRLVECNGLEVQESILTGESVSISKSPKAIRIPSRHLALVKCRGNAFMGTMVTRGTAIGIAVRSGANTEIGFIGAELNRASQEDPTASPLHKKLTLLGMILVIIAVFLCTVVALIGWLRGISLSDIVRLAISLAVSVIPEGLVAVLTASLALAVRRLAKDSVLVRRLSAVETLGVITVAAADKTGTLTEGKMQMSEIWTPGGDNYLDLCYKVCALCNNASNDGIIGEPTEVALIKGCLQKGVNIYEIRFDYIRVCEIPFDSDRKMMTVITKTKDDYTSFSKGATEFLIPKCSSVVIDSQIFPMSESILQGIFKKENELSDSGLRVLGMAVKYNLSVEDITSISTDQSEKSSQDRFEQDFIFVGLVSIKDPPRKEVSESVKLLQRAGVKVCMITGDHTRTAKAIANEVGIFDPSNPSLSRVIRGKDIDLLSIEDLASLRPFPCVFARVSPANKLAIVKALQLRGEIVAMTGDGVNDAPAIRKADVGIAMAKTGTEITRDAASILLLNDDFSSIPAAIANGRQIYKNLTLFIIYLLSCNSAEIWTILIALSLGWNSPFSPMNILWANIIADIPPSMSLCMERSKIELLLEESPKTVASGLLSRNTWILVGVNGGVLSALTLVIYGSLEGKTDEITQRSEAFVILIGLQLFLALLSRSPSESILKLGLFGNLYLFLAVLLSFALLVAGVYVPFLYRFLDLTPVPWLVWIKLVICSVILTFFNEVTKLIIYNKLDSC